jgi:hypothetical protein
MNRHLAHQRRDEGSTLILALVVMLVGSFFVLPLMSYIMTVNQASRMRIQGANSAEVVRGGLRSVLYDPSALYSACAPSGATDASAVNLAVPPGLDISTKCTTTANANQWVPSDLRWAMATTMVGAATAIPAPYVAPVSKPELDGTISDVWCTSVVTKSLPCGKAYANPTPADPAWWHNNDATDASTGSKIFLPFLPNPPGDPLNPGAITGFAGGYDVTVGPSQVCKVYFPGTYTDDVVITGTTPVYFVSGVYNFEKALRFSGDAQVVVGAGAADGCIESDAVAIADAGYADATSSGVGATFVFGANGRMMIDTVTPSTKPAGISVTFNRRLVAETDADSIMNNVAIMSVNGVRDAVDPNKTVALLVPNLLDVPASQVYLPARPDPISKGYKPSTLVPAMVPTGGFPCGIPPTVPATTCPIVDINLTRTTPVVVNIPGYVAVPQGGVSINTAAGMSTGKDVAFGGGILAATIGVSANRPAAFQLGLLNSVVQKTFKIVSQTNITTPRVTATALVQVNQTGGYAINSWVTSFG